MGRLRLALRKATSSSGYAIMNLITLPYYRFFRQNTLLPILAIANAAKPPKSDARLAMMLSSWRDRKLHELYFIQVAVRSLHFPTPTCEVESTFPLSLVRRRIVVSYEYFCL